MAAGEHPGTAPSAEPFDPRRFRLDGRTALVTGGGQGIGEAIAIGLARAGASVVILDVNRQTAERTAGAIQAGGGTALALEADVREPAAIEGVLAQARAGFGPVGVLINNAGIAIRKPILDLSDDEARAVVDTNLFGTIHCARAVARDMIEQGAGRIVNIASISAVHGMVNRVVYCATKGGVAGFTRALAMEWAQYGIRVNAIGPGIIATPLLANYLAANPDKRARAEADVPLGRLGAPSDIVGAALFLASEAASYITGQVLYVDGGLIAGDTWW